ncbi:MAG: hypothetical protein IKM91_04135 [Candidatus Methanomethylophilaceae archaeon]|nr:hypothetical protein [Candidatus Methanomethylophilaceae archaeon]
MDNKIVLVIVAILIAAAAVAAFALSQNTEDTDKNFVTYYGNGGALGETTSVKSLETTVKDCNFQNGSKAFLSWNTKADGTGKTYEVGDNVDLGTKLYAQWSANVLKVENPSYLLPLAGLKLYYTDGSHNMEPAPLAIPLSSSGTVKLFLGKWDEVSWDQSASRFTGKTTTGFSLTQKVSVTGGDATFSVEDGYGLITIAYTGAVTVDFSNS